MRGLTPDGLVGRSRAARLAAGIAAALMACLAVVAAAAATLTPGVVSLTGDGTIAVGHQPYGVAVSRVGPGAGNVYVANQGGGTLSVISSINTLLATVTVDDDPSGVAVSPIGPAAGDVYVTNTGSGTVSVISPTTNTVTSTIRVGAEPLGVAVSSTGPEAGDIYVTNAGSGTVSVIDPVTETVVASVPVGSPSGVAVSPTGPEAGYIYVTNAGDNTVSVIDPANNTVIATVPVGTEPLDVAVSPAGPEAGYIYVTNAGDNTVSVIDPTDNTVIATITVGSTPREVTISPDGSTAYVCDIGSDAVSAIDLSSGAVANTPTGSNPEGIAVSADGSTVYASNIGSDTLSVLVATEVSVPTIALPGSESVPNVGDTLTAVPGAWLPSAVSYQWNAGGQAIAGATSSSFTVTAAQVGQPITVTVSGSAGSESSAATAEVATPATGPGPTTTTPTTTTPATIAQQLTVRISGVKRNATYFAAAPAAHCASHVNTGSVSCRLTRRVARTKSGAAVTYTARATGSAGAEATARVTVHVTELELGGLHASRGIYRVRPGGHYTLRVASGTRPLYTGIAVAHRISARVHQRLRRHGSVRGVPVWTLRLQLPASLSDSRTSSLRIRIGDRTRALRIRA